MNFTAAEQGSMIPSDESDTLSKFGSFSAPQQVESAHEERYYQVVSNHPFNVASSPFRAESLSLPTRVSSGTNDAHQEMRPKGNSNMYEEMLGDTFATFAGKDKDWFTEDGAKNIFGERFAIKEYKDSSVITPLIPGIYEMLSLSVNKIVDFSGRRSILSTDCSTFLDKLPVGIGWVPTYDAAPYKMVMFHYTCACILFSFDHYRERISQHFLNMSAFKMKYHALLEHIYDKDLPSLLHFRNVLVLSLDFADTRNVSKWLFLHFVPLLTGAKKASKGGKPSVRNRSLYAIFDVEYENKYLESEILACVEKHFNMGSEKVYQLEKTLEMDSHLDIPGREGTIVATADIRFVHNAVIGTSAYLVSILRRGRLLATHVGKFQSSAEIDRSIKGSELHQFLFRWMMTDQPGMALKGLCESTHESCPLEEDDVDVLHYVETYLKNPEIVLPLDTEIHQHVFETRTQRGSSSSSAARLRSGSDEGRGNGQLRFAVGQASSPTSGNSKKNSRRRLASQSASSAVARKSQKGCPLQSGKRDDGQVTGQLDEGLYQWNSCSSLYPVSSSSSSAAAENGTAILTPPMNADGDSTNAAPMSRFNSGNSCDDLVSKHPDVDPKIDWVKNKKRSQFPRRT